MRVARVALGGLLGVFFLTSLPSMAAPAAERNASYDDTGLLRKRFLAAVYAAKRPENYDHAESLVDVLLSIEKDFALNLQTRDMIQTIGKVSPRFKELYDPKAAKGIAYYQPLEKAASMEKAALRNRFLADAINLTGLCLPKDAAYNLRYVDFLERQTWPAMKTGTEPLRYALYLRMYKRDCLAERDFLARTRSLVPAVRRAMLADGIDAGDVGSYLYLLAAAKRLEHAPSELIARFTQAQEEGGSWPSTQVGDVSVAAAQGAYVMAALLAQRGVSVTAPELFYAESTRPKLPKPVPFREKH